MCLAAHLLQVYKFNVPTFGPGVVFDVNWKIRSEQIRFFADSLRTERLKGYVPQFTMEIEVAPHPSPLGMQWCPGASAGPPKTQNRPVKRQH